MTEKQFEECLRNSMIRYSNLLQSDILLLNPDGTTFLSTDKTAVTKPFFPLPLDQCIDQPIQLNNKREYSLTPYYYCLPVLVHGVPRYFAVVSGFDNTRLSRECALVAAGLAELIHQIEKALPNPLSLSSSHPQSQLVEYVCQNQSDAQLQTLLHTLKLDPNMLRAVICIEFSFSSPNYFEGLGSMEYEVLRENLYSDVLKYVRGHSYLNRHDLCAIINKDELVIIKAFPISSNKLKVYKTIDTICSHLLQELSQFGIFEIHMAHGNLTSVFAELHSSYIEAKRFLDIGKHQYPDVEYYNAHNLMMNLICQDINPQIEAKILRPLLRALENNSGELQIELLQCAETLVDSCMSYSVASQKLQLHRNTIHTRMERFCEDTGLDPLHNFYDAVAVKLAAIFYRQVTYNTSKGEN